MANQESFSSAVGHVDVGVAFDFDHERGLLRDVHHFERGVIDVLDHVEAGGGTPAVDGFQGVCFGAEEDDAA